MTRHGHYDPYRLGGGYLLDQIPTIAMGQVLQRLADGDWIVLARANKGYAWERTDETVAPSTVQALLRRHWTEEPMFPLPLFGDRGDSQLTDRGWAALDRLNGFE
jgi:hypothetical protein